MPIDLSAVDLDAPLFPARGEEGTATPASAPESEHTPEPTGNAQPTDGGNPSVPEQNVPYSRFRDAIEARREAEHRAEEAEAREAHARERAERIASEPRPRRTETDFADSGYRAWATIYGDNENTRKAYAIELERQDGLREEMRREAVDAVRAERDTEARVVSTNVGLIDERLEDFSFNLGRPVTPQEESALLDIVDEYTPTDADGQYAGDLIGFDKAWEILQMRQNAVGQRASSARRTPTALTSSPSQGETTITDKATADKNWNPRDWNAWQKRIPR